VAIELSLTISERRHLTVLAIAPTPEPALADRRRPAA
jgi:hypothetical protein